VTLDGTGSSDSDGTIVSYVWTAGGTQLATGASPSVYHNLLNLGGPWSARTTAIWFKLDAVNGRRLVLEEGGATRGFNIYVDNGTLYVGGWDKARDGSDVDTWNGTWLNLGRVSTGQWYHVALVLNGAELRGV